jgi:hypothetical protein
LDYSSVLAWTISQFALESRLRASKRDGTREFPYLMSSMFSLNFFKVKQFLNFFFKDTHGESNQHQTQAISSSKPSDAKFFDVGSF